MAGAQSVTDPATLRVAFTEGAPTSLLVVQASTAYRPVGPAGGPGENTHARTRPRDAKRA
jgi:hypothetical protein